MSAIRSRYDETQSYDVRETDENVEYMADTPIYGEPYANDVVPFRHYRNVAGWYDYLFGVGSRYGIITWLLLLPFVVFYALVIVPIIWFLTTIYTVLTFIWNNLFLILLILLLGVASLYVYSEYQAIISNGLYEYRCHVVPYWNENYKEPLEGAGEGFNDFACWFNLATLTNRIISGQMLIRMFRSCENGFSLKQWISLTIKTISHFSKVLLVWVYETKTLETAIASRAAFAQLYLEWVPYTNDGVVCACEDIEFISTWFTRVVKHDAWPCFSNHIVNFVAEMVQIPVSFMFDMMRFILFASYDGKTSGDIVSALDDYRTAGNTLGSLSKAIPKERLASAAAYVGIGLNHAVTATYCHFTSQIDGLGSSSAANALYTTCYGNQTNHYDLFGIAGPTVAIFFRLMSLQTKALVHIREIWNDTATQPPGYRYTIDQLWGADTERVFDTVRPRRVVMNYTTSVNYPVPAVFPGGAPNPPLPVILFSNNTDLYGNTSNTTCDSYFNHRDMVACSECGIVIDYALTTRLNITAHELDRFMSNFLNMSIWTPTLGISTVAALEGATEAARFLSGFFIHVLNRDRLLHWLTDQNLYDHFFDAVVGHPYQFGGIPLGIRTGLVEFDSRLYCLGNLAMKIQKAVFEGGRIGTTILCRFFNTLDTSNNEPTLKTYLCISSATCLELERAFSWLRRPRLTFAYDPTFSYVPPALFIGSSALEPAFLDCLCWLLDFEFLAVFMPVVPSDLPEFCCFFHYFARWTIENNIIFIELGISVIESAMSIFDPTSSVHIVTIEWIACYDYYRCTNMAAIISDLEDLLNCGCIFLFWLSDTIDPMRNVFPCICDFLSAAVQWWTYLERATLEFYSAFFDILVCLTNGWPTPHCTTTLHARFTSAFLHLDTSFAAMSGMWGGLGCVVGLPWVGLEIDCLGTRYTWPFDHNVCNTSPHGYGICTMADRMRMIAYYISEFFQVAFKFFYQRVQLVIDVGFGFIAPGSVNDNTISLAIQRFLLLIRDPFFGHSNKLLNENFEQTSSGGPWPNWTGLNMTKVNQTIAQYQNITNIQGYSYEFPSSATVYNRTFSYSTIPGLSETTGMFQAIGLTLNCFLGLPGATCIGPPLHAPSTIVGNTGCLGDVIIAITNGIRDVYTMIIKFITYGMNVIEVLFMDRNGFGEAVRLFINSFFQLLLVILDNMQLLMDAILMVIVECARFILGDGVAEMLKFFLTFIANVIGIFITVIKSLLFFFLKKRVETSDGYAFNVEWSNDTSLPENDMFAFLGSINITASSASQNDTYSVKRAALKQSEHLSNLVSKYYKMGYNRIFVSKKKEKQEEKEDKRRSDSPVDWTEIWKRFDFGAFTYADAERMTDDTYCKKAMLELTPKDGYVDFGELSLANELIWKSCFVAYAFPNEIYGMTGGKLDLDPDTFYNIDKVESLLTSVLKTISDRIEWSAQQGGFIGYLPDYGVVSNSYDTQTGQRLFNYTVTADIPLSIMELISMQIEQRRQDVSRDLFVSSFQYTTLAPTSPTDTSLKKRGTIPLIASKTRFNDMRKRLDIFDTTTTNQNQAVDWAEIGDATCVPYIRKNINGCHNLDHYEPGYIVQFGSNAVGNITDGGWLDGRYWSNGSPDMYALTLFNNSNVTIYTNLRGSAYVYSSATDTTYPVVNGKISYRLNRTSFIDYTASSYTENSAAYRVAQYSVEQAASSELNNYLIMQNNVRGNVAPKDVDNPHFQNSNAADPLDDIVRNDTDYFSKFKRMFDKKTLNVAKSTSQFLKLLKMHDKWIETVKKSKETDHVYYGYLYHAVKHSTSEEEFSKFFNASKVLFSTRSEQNDKQQQRRTYDSLKNDANVVWLKTMASKPILYTEDRASATYVMRRRSVPHTQHALYWDEIRDEKDERVVNYVYKKAFFRKTTGDTDVLHAQKLRTVDRMLEIKRHQERTLTGFSFADYFTKTIPEAMKHYGYAVSGVGRVAYERKLNKSRRYHEWVAKEGTTSLAMALRLRDDDDESAFDIDRDFFVLDMDHPWTEPKRSETTGNIEQSISYEKRVKKLFKMVYVAPSDDDDVPDSLEDKMDDFRNGQSNVGYPFYLDRHDHLVKYALSYMHHASEHFDSNVEHDHNHQTARVLHLGFDNYELNDYTSFYGRNRYCKDGDDDNDSTHEELKRLYVIARRLKCTVGCKDGDDIIYVDLGTDGYERNELASLVTDLTDKLSKYLSVRLSVKNDSTSKLVSSLSRLADGKTAEYDTHIENYRFEANIVSNKEDNDTWVYDFTTISSTLCMEKRGRKRENTSHEPPKAQTKPRKTFFEFLNDVVSTRIEKTLQSASTAIASAMRYVREKHTETYAKGVVPALDRSLILLFDPKTGYMSDLESMFGETVTGFIPNKKKRDDALRSYLAWSASSPPASKDDKKRYDDVFKNAVSLQYCLPRNPSDTTVTRCGKCSSCNRDFCADCNDCAQCYLGVNGSYACDSCSNCRFNGPYCTGECVECEDCYESEPCLKCRLVEYVLKKLVYTANQCYATGVLNMSAVSVYPQKAPNWTLIERVPINDTSYPSFSDYGVLGIPIFVIKSLFAAINDLLDFDIFKTAFNFVTNMRFSIFEGNVGLFYIVWDYFFGPCDIDVHVACTFGYGLETGIVIATVITFVFSVPMWFIDTRVAGLFMTLIGLLASGSVVWFWGGMVAYYSWNYPPKCYVSGSYFLLTNLLGWNILPSFYLPLCAMNEINALAAKIFAPIVLPSYIVVNNVTASSTCDVVEEIVDCTQFGFADPLSVDGLFSIVGYIGQRWFPYDVRFWTIDYLNRTALGSNPYIAGSSGPLAPIYAVNYTSTLASSNTQSVDFCFYINLPYVIFMILTFALLLTLFFYLISGLFQALYPVFMFFYMAPFWNVFTGANTVYPRNYFGKSNTPKTRSYPKPSNKKTKKDPNPKKTPKTTSTSPLKNTKKSKMKSK